MNILLSLLVYNPIEAYTLILLCDIITGSKTNVKIKTIPYFYIFGSVNMAIQLFPTIWVWKCWFAVINIFVNYFITPFSIMLFYGIVNSKISYRKCFVVSAIECAFVIVISEIIVLFIKDYNMFYTENILYEFITNITIFSVQIILYSIIKIRGDCYYEKHRKNRS